MKILVIGAGNGGLALSSKLIERGVSVNLYDKYEEIINPIQKNNNEINIVLGEDKKSLKFDMVTNKLEYGIANTDFIFVVVPAFAHKSIAMDLSMYISDHQVVVLHPGRTGGAFEFKRVFNQREIKSIVAETETMLFACRKNSPIEINIYGTKQSVGIATLPEAVSEHVCDQINQLLPHFHNCKNVLFTSLSNIGAIFHPAPFLLNLSRIESGEKFKYYHEGITPSIANLLESLDSERREIAKCFGLRLLSAREWVNYNYRVQGKTLYDAIQKNRSYEDIYAPNDSGSRYVMEDIPMSLVPMKKLAMSVDVKTPTIDSIITIANNLYNCDFLEKARTIDEGDLKQLEI